MSIKTSQFKPGDRVTWVRSPGRSFLTGWRVERVPGVVTRVCRRRVMLRVRLASTEKLVIVNPENLISEEESSDSLLRTDGDAMRG
jgi:hypothetical protein